MSRSEGRAPRTSSVARLVLGHRHSLAVLVAIVASLCVGFAAETVAFSGTASPAPTVSITNPTSGQTATANGILDIAAAVSDTTTAIASVDFYVNNGATSVLLGTVTTSPYNFRWTSVPAGSYSVWAVATNTAGQNTRSSAVAFTVAAAMQTDWGPLPLGWIDRDIGAVGTIGSPAYNHGTFTLRGAGADIWSTADAFNFASMPLTSDGVITAHVHSMQNTAVHAKAGVMIRETFAAGSTNVILDRKPDGGVEFMARTTTGGSTSFIAGGTGSWLRLSRSRGVFTAYVSSDGTTWTQVGSQPVSMSSNAWWGLAVCSHNSLALNTSMFDYVAVTDAGGASKVSIGNPPTGSVFAAGSNVTVTAWAHTTIVEPIYSVTFYANNAQTNLRIGGATYPVYCSLRCTGSYSVFPSITWANVPAGVYSLTAVVVSNGQATSREPVGVTVSGSGVAPGTPTAPSPANGATGVAANTSLAWTSSGATSFTMFFGTSAPPPQVATGLGSASYQPAGLQANTTYFWQVVAANSAASSTGPVWQFTTASVLPPPPANVVVYAGDVLAGSIHGAWSLAPDATAAGGTKLVSTDNNLSWTTAPQATPTHYFEMMFNANAGVPYAIWLRLQALANSKYNDSVWVQFSDALASGAPVYQIGTTNGLLVNLATDSTGSSLSGWGWQHGAYWLSQATTVTFATSGSHTMRIQVREDGVELDQMVLSPTTYLTKGPGGSTADKVIVPKL